jgi:LPS export ABC transporter protein LptC/lipopolysaccharide transport protein LptA
MVNKKSLNIIVIFGVLTAVVFFQSFNVSRKKQATQIPIDIERDQETEFINLKYFSVEDSKPALNINADVLKMINNKDLNFQNPQGFLFNENGEKLTYDANFGSYLGDKRELSLSGDVSVKNAKGSHESDRLFYDGKKKFFEATGKVKSVMNDLLTRDSIIVESRSMYSWMNEGKSVFNGDVVGKVKRRRIYEESFDFMADQLELNQLNSLVTLSNNVKLDRNNYHLEARKAEIFLENYNKKLKYYVLYDDIKLVERLELRNGKTQLRRAYSEKLEGYMSEAKVVLSGAPRVEQGNDLIKGYQITLRENVELVEVDDSQSSFELKRN